MVNWSLIKNWHINVSKQTTDCRVQCLQWTAEPEHHWPRHFFASVSPAPHIAQQSTHCLIAHVAVARHGHLVRALTRCPWSNCLSDCIRLYFPGFTPFAISDILLVCLGVKIFFIPKGGTFIHVPPPLATCLMHSKIAHFNKCKHVGVNT